MAAQGERCRERASDRDPVVRLLVVEQRERIQTLCRHLVAALAGDLGFEAHLVVTGDQQRVVHDGHARSGVAHPRDLVAVEPQPHLDRAVGWRLGTEPHPLGRGEREAVDVDVVLLAQPAETSLGDAKRLRLE